MDEQPTTEFDPDLHRGQTLTNDELRQLFKCSGVGSMRRSHGTNSLVLISGESAGPYRDRFEGNDFHFTGRGLQGDQDLDEVQNRTLADSNTNGVAVFHFDNPQGDRYVYTGRMKLAGAPYTEQQTDELGVDRQVWMFPLTVQPGKGELAHAVRHVAAAEAEIEERAKGWWARFVGWLRKLVGRA